MDKLLLGNIDSLLCLFLADGFLLLLSKELVERVLDKVHILYKTSNDTDLIGNSILLIALAAMLQSMSQSKGNQGEARKYSFTIIIVV